MFELMTMNGNESIEKTIRGYFNGQLSAEEEKDLAQWINRSNSNKAYFEEVKRALVPEEMEHPLLESSFIELKDRLLINRLISARHSGRIRQISISLQKVAAILTIALVAGFSAAYLLLQKPEPKSELSWFEIQVPRGEKTKLLLPDGSLVWINSESILSYPNNYMEGNREVRLKGEAYFEVENQQDKPFIVKTTDYNICVLGTKFNVMAYPDFNRTSTWLIEGMVEIQRGKQAIPMGTGQNLEFSDNQFTIKNENALQSACWKDNIFDFDQINFKELIIRLERWYDIDIEVKGQNLDNIVYSGVFKNEETIWQVLNSLRLMLPIQYKREGFRKFVITEKE